MVMVRILNRLDRPGTYGLLSRSFLLSYCATLFSIALIGLVSPSPSYHSCTLPHARSSPWQGGGHVIPL